MCNTRLEQMDDGLSEAGAGSSSGGGGIRRFRPATDEDRVKTYRGLIAKATQEKTKIQTQLRSERKRYDELHRDMEEEKRYITRLHRILIEATGGIEFESRLVDGRLRTDIKEHIGDEAKLEIPVNALTEVLDTYNVLEPVLKRLHQLQDLSDKDFLDGGRCKGGAPAKEGGKPLVAQLRMGLDPEQFERRENDLKMKENRLEEQRMALEAKERVVEERHKLNLQVVEDGYIALLRKELERMQAKYDDAYVEGINNILHSTAMEYEPTAPAMGCERSAPAGEADEQPAEEPEEELELNASREEVEELVGEPEVRKYNGVSEYYGFLEYE